MGNNYHTPYAAGVTNFSAASMNPVLAALDKAITYHKLAIVGCDGSISWSGGTLTWSGSIHIYFTREDGTAIHNSIAAGNIALADGEFAYVTLSETNDQVLTVSKASIGAGSASAFKAHNILVLGYRNAADDGFYPEELAGVFAKSLSSGDFLDGREQQITSDDSVTVNWANGATAYLTLDRATTAITLSNGQNGKVYRLRLIQDATGGRGVNWSTTIRWRGKTVPTITASAGAEDWFTFVYSNGNWYGDLAANFGTAS